MSKYIYLSFLLLPIKSASITRLYYEYHDYKTYAMNVMNIDNNMALEKKFLLPGVVFLLTGCNISTRYTLHTGIIFDTIFTNAKIIV